MDGGTAPAPADGPCRVAVRLASDSCRDTPSPARRLGRLEDVKSLWVGEVQPEWSEDFVKGLFAECGKSFKVKLMKDRSSGLSVGYGFLEFETHADAEEVLTKFADKPIPGTASKYSLRWGGGHGRTQRTYPVTVPPAVASDASIFVGDLDYSVTEAQLREAFAAKYRSVLSSKLVVDVGTGLSKGFGFVKFGDVTERDRAMVEMNGHFLGDRPIRCTTATTREERDQQQQHMVPKPAFTGLAAPKATEEGENTCVFVGGLDESVTPDMLRHHFGLLGDIAYIRIPPGRGCGFVGFVHRKNAEAAISTLQGLRINGYKVRLSWGSMRQGPKRAVPQQLKPGPVLPVTQVKKEHRTPFGAITNDFLETLPDPRPIWEKPQRPPLRDEPRLEEVGPPPRLAKTANVPMSPYVAQLKARYEAYRNAAETAPASKRRRPSDDVDARAPPGDRYSHYSKRTSRPAKRRLTPDDVHRENFAFANDFLLKTLTILASGVLLPLKRPLPLAAHYDAYADTPMAAYVQAEAQAKQQG